MKGWSPTDEICAAKYGDHFRWCPNLQKRKIGQQKWNLGPVSDWLEAATQADLDTYDLLMQADPPPIGSGRIERLLHAADVTGARFGPLDRLTEELRTRIELEVPGY